MTRCGCSHRARRRARPVRPGIQQPRESAIHAQEHLSVHLALQPAPADHHHPDHRRLLPLPLCGAGAAQDHRQRRHRGPRLSTHGPGNHVRPDELSADALRHPPGAAAHQWRVPDVDQHLQEHVLRAHDPAPALHAVRTHPALSHAPFRTRLPGRALRHDRGRGGAHSRIHLRCHRAPRFPGRHAAGDPLFHVRPGPGARRCRHRPHPRSGLCDPQAAEPDQPSRA